MVELARSLEIAENLKEIVKNVNAITEEELEAYLREISRDEAFGPMIDPTGWQWGGKFDAASKTKKVLRALLEFKKEVKGIGDFT